MILFSQIISQIEICVILSITDIELYILLMKKIGLHNNYYICLNLFLQIV